MDNKEEFRTEMMAFLKLNRLILKGHSNATIEYISFGRWLVRW